MTVYDEWTPLKKVLIGKTYDVSKVEDEFENKILMEYDNTVRNRSVEYADNTLDYTNHKRDIKEQLPLYKDTLKKIHDETNEDLNLLAKLCQQYGAEVVRPDVIPNIEDGLSHPMQCRDTIGKIGNTIFEVYTAKKERGLENLNHQRVMLDEFKNGARYIAMPPMMYESKPQQVTTDIDEVNRYCNEKIESYDNQNCIIGDTAAFYKCGKHIFHTFANPQDRLGIKEHSQICITNNGLEWYKREFPKHEFIEMQAYGHVDGKIAILRPGLVLTWKKEYVPKIMVDNNWDIIIMDPSAEYDGKTIKALCEERGVKNYPMPELLGVAQETRFDCNVLSLDENTIITSGYDKNLADKLKKYNIEMIPWVNRWNFLWSGGAHCCSLDLKRTGKLENYFND